MSALIKIRRIALHGGIMVRGKLALNVADKRARAKQRARLGKLQDNRVQASTTLRYDAAVLRFLNWLGSDIPATTEALDECLSNYAEQLWEDGEGRNLLGDALSGLSHHFSSLKGKLAEAWRQCNVWGKLEFLARATPISIRILRAAC
eukprot:8802655-Karenia_brevis.AAC.1